MHFSSKTPVSVLLLSLTSILTAICRPSNAFVLPSSRRSTRGSDCRLCKRRTTPCWSQPKDNNGEQEDVLDDNTGNHDADLAVVQYKSRSTSSPEPAISQVFEEGSEERRRRLHLALQDIGVLEDDWLERPEFRGSAALRTYSSFILPKSKGGLAMANQPQRAFVVANQISFLMREHRSHQKEWLRNHDRTLEEAEAILNDQNKSEPHPIILLLDDIRSAPNVGNILRLAEAARVEKVLLCGSMTPAPPHPKVLKTALGAADYVPFASVGSTLQAVQDLQARGVKVYGVETTSESIPLWKVDFFEATTTKNNATATIPTVAFVFGNELVGVDAQILQICNGLVAVPTHGIKNSLNVATCASVITWEALRQWEAKQDILGQQ